SGELRSLNRQPKTREERAFHLGGAGAPAHASAGKTCFSNFSQLPSREGIQADFLSTSHRHPNGVRGLLKPSRWRGVPLPKGHRAAPHPIVFILCGKRPEYGWLVSSEETPFRPPENSINCPKQMERGFARTPLPGGLGRHEEDFMKSHSIAAYEL